MPQSAVVMMGTNDIGWFVDREAPTSSQMAQAFRWWSDAYIEMIDTMLEHGVVPIVMTIPPKTNISFVESYVTTLNLFIRALTEVRQVPLIDYYAELEALGEPFGLWADGVHPKSRGTSGCDLSSRGLEGGINVRNLVALEGLDRVSRVFLGEGAPDEEPGLPVVGDGSLETPFEVDRLPFWHGHTTEGAIESRIDSYPVCHTNDQDESGPETYYRFELNQEARLRIGLVDPAGVDVDLHLLSERPEAADCLARSDTLLEGRLSPGVYFIVADTFVSGSSSSLAGEYLLSIHHCRSEESQCDDWF
jgi:hypothetical protein